VQRGCAPASSAPRTAKEIGAWLANTGQRGNRTSGAAKAKMGNVVRLPCAEPKIEYALGGIAPLVNTAPLIGAPRLESFEISWHEREFTKLVGLLVDSGYLQANETKHSEAIARAVEALLVAARQQTPQHTLDQGLVTCVVERVGTTPFTVRELLQHAEVDDALRATLVDLKLMNRVKLGKRLKAIADQDRELGREFDGIVVTRLGFDRGNVALWRCCTGLK
jgi:hypothetical protein